MPRDEARRTALAAFGGRTYWIEQARDEQRSRLLEDFTRDVVQVNQGSLYPALHRLTRQGFITSSWRVTENSRRARYYALTAAGRRALSAEHTSWERISEAVNLIMRMSPG